MFGLHVHRSATTTGWPRVAFGTWRLWDTVQWASVEPERGRFEFDQLDALVAQKAAHGVRDMVFVFGRVPSWASAKPAAPCVYANSAQASIATLSRRNGVVTLRTRTPLDAGVNDGIGITGAADASFDGGFTAATVAGPGSVTYRQSGPDGTSTNGTVVREGGCAGPVADIGDLSAFARTLVRRYCGVIRYWELWNEPNQPGFWAGSLATLVRQSAVVYSVVKDPANCSVGGANPNVVLSPAPSDIRSGWLYDWLTHGGAASSDVIAFHGYEFTVAPELMPYYLGRVRGWMSAAGKREAQLWDTEGSWGANAGVPPLQRRSWLARAYTIQAASGVDRFIWYAYDNAEFGTLWERGSGQNQAGDAYEQLRQWLTGGRIEPCDTRASGTWICRVTRAGGYHAAIVWNARAQASITLPWRALLASAAQWRDLSGRRHAVSGKTIEIGQQPILLENHDVSGERRQ